MTFEDARRIQRKIRTNPNARVTDTLKDVFGR